MKDLLKKYLNKLAYALGYLPRPQFPQAGIGCGGIFFLQLGPRHVRVFLASRADVVGAGSGISFGGWMRLNSLYGKTDGAYITAQAAAVAEAIQEIPGILKVIPKFDLLHNLQFVFGAGVYKPDDVWGNVFHGTTYFGLPLANEAEATALCNLPKSRETSAPLRGFDLTWTKPDVSDLTGLPDDFHHPHEPEAIKALCWMLEHGLLRTNRVATESLAV